MLIALAPVAVGDDDNEFRASLNGYLEVPSIATAARGSFRAELDGGMLNYRLTLRGFSEDVLFAHIHLLIRAMRNGATYANAHTNTCQPGESRGNITRDD